jgi:DoxX-like family
VIEMNIVLWALQILVGLAFIASGGMKTLRVDQIRSGGQMKWAGEVLSRNLVIFIGASELLGGLGLILPAVTGILTWLTPLAGACLSVVMVLAFGYHVSRHESNRLAPAIVLFLLAAFIAIGRFAILPL